MRVKFLSVRKVGDEVVEAVRSPNNSVPSVVVA